MVPEVSQARVPLPGEATHGRAVSLFDSGIAAAPVLVLLRIHPASHARAAYLTAKAWRRDSQAL